ncbi:MAG: phage portal protein, partial [Coriobacteriales bacterium]|nr:phage portal protein [Coriobacteriales bacterium]
MMHFSIRNVSGLTEAEQTMLNGLVQVWSRKLTRNSLRTKYYDMKNRLKDLGIAIPPPLQNVETVIGWPAKAVDALAARSRFDGFVTEGEEVSELAAVLRANDFSNLYGQSVASELIHSCSFLTVSKGADGEPTVLINAYSAVNAAALWDKRKKRIKCGLTVVEADDTQSPTWVNLYTDDEVIALKKVKDTWTVERYPHLQGRPLIEPLVYRPALDRPLGKSRISR